MLIESPVYEMLFEVAVRGVAPIIAHVAGCIRIIQAPNLINKIVHVVELDMHLSHSTALGGSFKALVEAAQYVVDDGPKSVV